MIQKIDQKWLDQAYATLSKFADIPLAEWEKRIQITKHLHLEKNEYFVRVGSVPDKIAFIISGIFRVFYTTETGDERILVFRGEGRLLSAFSAFLEDKPSWFNIQALEDADLLYIGLDDYKESLSYHECWRTVNSKYIEMLFIEKEKRESEFLSDNAETRYQNFLVKYPDIEKRINQYHIAAYLGITPVALSRIRKKLNEK